MLRKFLGVKFGWGSLIAFSLAGLHRTVADNLLVGLVICFGLGFIGAIVDRALEALRG